MDFSKKFTIGDISVKIQSVEPIDGGVEIFAQAWKGDRQLGFGPDGSVDIERFRIFNPPILVDDPNGNIVNTYTSTISGEKKTRRLREDPNEALGQTLAHTIKLSTREGTIQPGKVGNTVSTFFPDPNVETTSVDGYSRKGASTWAGTRDAASGDAADDSSATELYCLAEREGGSSYRVWRSFMLFDTSALPDTDAISAATLSMYGNTNYNAGPDSIVIVSSNPASNTAIVTGDFNDFGTTALSGTIARSSFNTSAYNDFTLNASGIANITQTGVSKFAMILEKDRTNTAPTVVESSGACAYAADQSGTANDPKLVIVHSAAATGHQKNILTLGCG